MVTKRLQFPSVYRLGQLCLDGTVAWLACSLAFLLRFEADIPSSHDDLAWVLPLVAIPGRLAIQAGFGTYQQIWRLFGFKDALTLFNGITFYSLLVLVVTRLLLPRVIAVPGIPLGVSTIDWCFCLMGMGALRYCRRWSLRRRRPRQCLESGASRRVLLVGAGFAGAQMVLESRQNRSLQIEVVGFIDDDPTKQGRKVEGVKVLGDTSRLVSIARGLQVEQIILSMPSAPAARLRQLVHQVNRSGLTLKTLPGPAEILQDKQLIPQARDLQITDILGRPEVYLNFSEQLCPPIPSAHDQVHGQVVLVTGAGGTIGSELCRQLARLRPKLLLLLGRGENSIFHIERELRADFPELALAPIIADIRHHHRMASVFHTWRPDLVFHAAAHKHVPLMQANPTEAIDNNAIASARLAQLSSQFGIKTFVLISTDKAVTPSNFMGLSKRLAELLLQAYATHSPTRFLTVRFGNVLGSRGSVVPLFKEQIARGGPVTVTHPKMTRYFMTIPEASRLVVQSLAVGESGQILVLDMGNPVKIVDLAVQMIHLAGCIPDVDIPIQFVGLRPGEKLHEALVNPHECLTTTDHPKIMVVKNGMADYQAQGVLRELQALVAAKEGQEQALWQACQRCLLQLEQGMQPWVISPSQ
ncbi:NAD-dependent epimerase [Halomicronema hongdechloris C2206]|uniref:NAD-dependent epimerase n=1 Tax=Halomicronema hongdechloris C2206 TaxID=1641165 RepID=A0A1Z3HQG8_9CYAN|nr:nucleoside-diphosphate sugar epimerase/dehydratase [Halomicronema hongdechloris]ASC72553.1 NAD-dependent epimerase [Halomicronema hongdechloris C2206]